MNKPKKLLAVGTNAKTVKGDKASEYLTAILYMAPHKHNDSKVNLCPDASTGCEAACLYTSGRGKFSSVQTSRINKANWFVKERDTFLAQLHKEILQHSYNARLQGKLPAVRLNGTTDIPWERYVSMEKYPEVQFYDYTKSVARVNASNLDKFPKNYNLTYSRSEDTDDKSIRFLMQHCNVAVVFKELPEEYLGYPVYDGDLTDLRFLDPRGHIIGLSAKGEAKKDTSGFVV